MIEQQVIDVFSTLLSQGNLVKQADLVDAQNIANDLSIPLHKALIMSGVASEAAINLALQAKTMVDQKLLSLDMAIRAVRLAVHNNTDLDMAISAIGRVHKTTQQVVSLTNELTALLLAAKIISSEQLGEAVKRAADTKMLMGHTLLLLNFVSSKMLAAALYAVLMMRQKILDKDKGTQGLRYAQQREITIEHALFELGFFTPQAPETMRLSELMHMANLLSQADLVECLEIELFKGKQFGQVMLEQGLINQEHLDAATTLQSSVANEALKPYQAALALRRVFQDNINLYQAMAEAQAIPGKDFRLGDLLCAAGICSHETIENVIDVSKKTDIKIGKVLLTAGVVNEPMLYNALRCQSLVRQGYYSADEAINSLTHCHKNSLNLDEALSALRSNPPSRMQWLWV